VTLPDVQSEPDVRGIGIDEVGISGLRYPVTVFQAEQGKQSTVASISLAVSLPPEQKGSHLSRFVEVLDEHAGELTPHSIPAMLQRLRDRLDARSATLVMEFPYFLRRAAPVSGASALIEYACGINASIHNDVVEFAISAGVPVTSVCPCSKAISDYGAHNQRGTVTIHAVPSWSDDADSVWLEDLIEAAEASGSSPVYPLLKREDERHVTMAAYDHPVFVEDMVRSVAERLRDDPRIVRFSVEAVNDESIHNHAAFARLAWPPSRPEATRW
jgi:GTP cyclohydrolase IB